MDQEVQPSRSDQVVAWLSGGWNLTILKHIFIDAFIFQIRELVRDFQHQVLQAHEQPYSEETCASIPQVRSDRNSHQRSNSILSRLSMSFRTDIMMTSEWTGLRSLRPSLTQVGSGESYVLRRFRFTDFMCRGTNTGAMMGAAHVVTTSVGMCDVDLRCLFCVIMTHNAKILEGWAVDVIKKIHRKYSEKLNGWT